MNKYASKFKISNRYILKSVNSYIITNVDIIKKLHEMKKSQFIFYTIKINFVSHNSFTFNN
ncbi:hypothetical protein LBMAG43_04520 [Methylococcaceae bacterium]|nr:hypothetical protein LBMAG43_04520 [Methylococcaceae bacterium]